MLGGGTEEVEQFTGEEPVAEDTLSRRVRCMSGASLLPAVFPRPKMSLTYLWRTQA